MLSSTFSDLKQKYEPPSAIWVFVLLQNSPRTFEKGECWLVSLRARMWLGEGLAERWMCGLLHPCITWEHAMWIRTKMATGGKLQRAREMQFRRVPMYYSPGVCVDTRSNVVPSIVNVSVTQYGVASLCAHFYFSICRISDISEVLPNKLYISGDLAVTEECIYQMQISCIIRGWWTTRLLLNALTIYLFIISTTHDLSPWTLY